MNEQILSQTERKYTGEDYLQLEKKNNESHEYYNSKTLSKSGIGRNHNLICSNMTIAIGSRIAGQKFEIYVNGMRVRLNSGNFCYPDLIVVGGNPQFDPVESDILLNPVVIVEVVSPLTSVRDRTEKLEGYLAMDSVKECLLVKEDAMRIDHYAKQNAKQWLYKIYNERDDVISLDAVNCKISLAEVYAQIKFRN